MHTSLCALLDGSLRDPVAVKILDVGASPFEGRPPYQPILDAGRAQVIGFEPNEQALAELLQKKSQQETYLPYAIGDGRKHTLRICQASGMTSLLEPNDEVLSLFHGFSEWGRVLRTEEVSTVRLDDIAETEGIDYFKIDIQGAELMVFENSTQRLKDVLVVHTEVEFLALYKGQPLFADVDAFMRSQGFLLHRFEPLVSRAMKPILVNNNPYAPYNQVMWADAIYVKSFLDLQSLSDRALAKQAYILHDCYRSYDLVHVLLSEFDRRTNAGLAARYLASVTT